MKIIQLLATFSLLFISVNSVPNLGALLEEPASVERARAMVQIASLIRKAIAGDPMMKSVEDKLTGLEAKWINKFGLDPIENHQNMVHEITGGKHDQRPTGNEFKSGLMHQLNVLHGMMKMKVAKKDSFEK